MIKLITFDLDDTLWDNAPAIIGAETLLRDWLTEHAPRLGPVPVEHLWAIRTRLFTDQQPAPPGVVPRPGGCRLRLR